MRLHDLDWAGLPRPLHQLHRVARQYARYGAHLVRYFDAFPQRFQPRDPGHLPLHQPAFVPDRVGAHRHQDQDSAASRNYRRPAHQRRAAGAADPAAIHCPGSSLQHLRGHRLPGHYVREPALDRPLAPAAHPRRLRLRHLLRPVYPRLLRVPQAVQGAPRVGEQQPQPKPLPAAHGARLDRPHLQHSPRHMGPVHQRQRRRPQSVAFVGGHPLQLFARRSSARVLLASRPDVCREPGDDALGDHLLRVCVLGLLRLCVGGAQELPSGILQGCEQARPVNECDIGGVWQHLVRERNVLKREPCLPSLLRAQAEHAQARLARFAVFRRGRQAILPRRQGEDAPVWRQRGRLHSEQVLRRAVSPGRRQPPACTRLQVRDRRLPRRVVRVGQLVPRRRVGCGIGGATRCTGTGACTQPARHRLDARSNLPSRPRRPTKTTVSIVALALLLDTHLLSVIPLYAWCSVCVRACITRRR